MAFVPIPEYQGEVPSRDQEPTVFAKNADDWLKYQPPMIAAINSAGNAIEGSQIAAQNAAGASAQSAADAARSAEAAQNIANFYGEWSGLTGALNKPATVLHKGGYWLLLRNLTNVTLSEPSVSADWSFSSGTRWRRTTAATTIFPKEQVVAEVTATTNITLTANAVAGDFFVISNASKSTADVRVVNAGYTIRSLSGSASTTDNIIIPRGGVLHLVAVSSIELEVV